MDVQIQIQWSDYPHLSEHQRRLAEEYARGLGDHAFADLLRSPPEQQIARLEAFEAFVLSQRAKAADRQAAAENAADRQAAEVASMLKAQELLQAQLAAALEQQRTMSEVVQSLATKKTPSRVAVRMDAPKFDGKECNKLVHWLMAVERCAHAQLVHDDEQMVAFGLSNLRGNAHEWAFSTLLADPHAFFSWRAFSDKILAMYQPPNNEVLLQGRFFAMRQDRRSLQQYVQEMTTICASITREPLPEAVKVPAFMNGLRNGPARTALFKSPPATMREAIDMAILEEQAHNSGLRHPWAKPDHHGHKGQGQGPAPMELDNADVVCFNCGKRGHIKARCTEKPRRSGYPRTGGTAPQRKSGGVSTAPKSGKGQAQ